MAIVLGYDGSDGARRALTVAIDLARRFGEPLHVGFSAQAPGRIGEELRAHLAVLEDMGRELTGEAVRAAREAGVTAEAHVRADRPVDMLLALAEEHDAYCIVVGCYGESPLRGAVVGATPHKLLHLSDRPVLAIPTA